MKFSAKLPVILTLCGLLCVGLVVAGGIWKEI
jgi:hypothetical protein